MDKVEAAMDGHVGVGTTRIARIGRPSAVKPRLPPRLN
jgi:hypothetical protein